MLPPKLPLAIDTRKVRALDGTEIAYHVTAGPSPDAPVVILANGLGGTYLAWRGIIDYLGARCRFITWDYRGLYASGRPKNDVQSAYAIPNHVRDLEAILAAEGVDKASFVGWSMGVQVLLEATRTLRPRMHDLVLLNGTFGRPLDTLSPLPGMKQVLPSLVDLARRVHSIATQMTRKATALPECVTWFKRLGLIGPTLDDGVFTELVQAFGQLDMETFFRNLRAIGEHDAADVLPRIDVPVLVVTGDRDLMTPVALAQQMARKIPSSEILVVRGGTHYTAVEYPELVSLRMERFYRETGFLPQ
ncbi:MAG TPA: alpha/beta hydrolase [Byssovorax sp.]|jgi:pimeloyl-ACP methyl ester carboxylesterase